MSSIGMMPPAVSLADVRGRQTVDHMKSSSDIRKGKVEKAAKDFESVLLSQWLSQAEQSFASLPGSNEDTDPGHDQFQSIGMQAIATAMSGAKGGLGIAAMVSKHLNKGETSGPAPTTEISGKQLHLKGLRDAAPHYIGHPAPRLPGER